MATAGKLTDHEQRIVEAAETGRLTDLRAREPDQDDPARGAMWNADRTVRADVLVELLVGERPGQVRRPRAIKVRGARIKGRLDLDACELACPLLLQDCYIEQPINLNDATAPAIRLPGCYFVSLNADQLRTAGDLELNGITALGRVSFRGADIGGRLNLSGASLNGLAYALFADGLTVKQSLHFQGGRTTRGEVRLIGAHIEGQLIFIGAHLNNARGPALSGDGMTIKQGAYFRGGFTAQGAVRVPGADIGDEFDLNGAHLVNPGGDALNCTGMTLRRNMGCGKGFAADGAVRLINAEIGGQFDLSGAHLTCPDGDALYCAGLTVRRDMTCGEGFTVEGTVSLFGATINGQLVFAGAHLRNPGGDALKGNFLTVGKSMYCEDGFIADGAVRLGGAQIRSQLSLINATLRNPGDDALFAAGIVVDNGIFCRDGFTVQGCVTLSNATIGGMLTFTEASLNNSDETALDLTAADVAELRLRPMHPPLGAVKLTNARIGNFDDDKKTWATTLHLRGFTYASLDNREIGVRARLRWLALDPDGYAPQPYDQLAAAYRRSGHQEAARRVGITKQWRRRGPANPLNWLIYATVGYGYRTWLAGIWLAGLAVLGSLVFTRADAHHLMQPGPNVPAFHAGAYTLDVLLPVVDLGQEKAWTPHGWALYLSWSLIAVGWILTTAAVAGLTGIFKRD
jgi:hypothetical protein